MEKIEFNALLNGAIRQVSLCGPVREGLPWQILIDKYYHGVLVIQRGQWVAQLNERSFLKANDIKRFCEMIDTPPHDGPDYDIHFMVAIPEMEACL